MNPVVEGWRGVAALLVVLAHFAPALGEASVIGPDSPLSRLAFTGVDLFFVLSGYVFARQLFSPFESLGAYSIRRAFRIVPAYWLAVAIYSGLLLYRTGDPGPWAQHLVFFHLTDPQTAFALNPAFWSLVPEVEFYLFLPVLSWLLKGRPERFFVLVVIALGLRLALAADADRASANLSFVLLHHLPGMLIEFLMGAAVWRLQSHGQWLRHWSVCILGVVLWSLLAAGVHGVSEPTLEEQIGVGQISLMAAIAFSLMVSGSVGHGDAVRRMEGPMFWAGALSYGVYLFHNAALAIAPSPLVALAGVIAFSALSYVLLERPARAFGRRLAIRLETQSTSVSPG